jgi:branched-chain amino acid transport system permease protein
MDELVRLLQLAINGTAAGCIYGLVALGFVLIYKATEMVNFAQGELMMLGAFFAYTFVGMWGMNYWVGFALAIAATAAFGYALDAVVLRRVIGQPQFAVVMLTLGLAFIFRAMAGAIWGYDSVGFLTPFTNKVSDFGGGVILGQDNVSIIIGTVILCAVLYVFFSRTPLGIAMQASSQNQLAAYYMGIPVKRLNGLVWGLAAAVAAIAGLLLAPITFVHANMGFVGLKAFPAAVVGGFGSLPGAIVGGLVIGLVESFAGFYAPEGWKDIAPYIVVLIMLWVKPNGLFSSSMRKKV